MPTIKLKKGGVLTLDGSSAVVEIEGKKMTMDGGIVQAMNVGVIDADGAIFFQRQLEHIKAKSYDVKYAELKARTLFPVSNEAGKGVDTIVYETYDAVGMAKIINAYSDDLPSADIAGKETRVPVRSVGNSYKYSIDEIQSAELTGLPLNQKRANASRKGVELKINNVAFYGDAPSGLSGLFDNPNIPTGAVVNGGSGTPWTTKTPEQILFDINDLFADIFESTKMVERPDTLMLPPSQWSYIMSTPRSINSDTTIAQYLVSNSPFLKSLEDIIAVNECSDAENPLLASDAMVAYCRDADKLELEIPVEYEAFPPQEKNLNFVVPARARIAGLNIYYPLSLAIATGI